MIHLMREIDNIINVLLVEVVREVFWDESVSVQDIYYHFNLEMVTKSSSYGQELN